MQNDERDNKNGNRKNEKNQENCHSLSPRFWKESREKIQQSQAMTKERNELQKLVKKYA